MSDSWRRRHPVFSRLLLYGLALVLAGTALWLWRAREDADREAYLRARLDQLDLVNFALPEGRAEARSVLAAEFGDPDLPTALRARALRIEAQLDAREGKSVVALERLDAAAALIEAPPERFALGLERATALQLAGRGEEALAALPEGASGSPILDLHGVMTRAWILAEQDRKDEAVEGLRAALGAAEKAWPADPSAEAPAYVGTVRPTALEALLQATRLLCGLRGCEAGDWQRVRRVFPDAYPAQEAAALGLLALERPAEARAAWARAQALDPRAAAQRGAANPELRHTLEKNEAGLQRDEVPGR